MADAERKTIQLTEYQAEIVIEALTEYLRESDPTDDWYIPTTDVISQIKEDD